MIAHAIDSAIGTFSPRWQLARTKARATLSQIDSVTGSAKGGYDGGKRNRLTKNLSSGTLTENSVPRNEIERLRGESWNLFRNNPHAKKILRNIKATVIGRGPVPQPQATTVDGEPHDEFRKLATTLWGEVSKEIDYRGRPGRGGQHLSVIHGTALQSTILGGECFLRFRHLTRRQKESRGLLLPLQVQLMHPNRLDDSKTGDGIYYGIEFDGDIRSGYWFLNPGQGSTTNIEKSKAEKARNVVHLYVEEDVDQVRGTPWFSAALLKMRDTSEYEFTELQAAAMAACVVLGYRRSSGQTDFGGIMPEDWDLNDADGNKLTAMQPGMIIDLGQNGALDAFNPQRPNNGATQFIEHMLRSQAAGVPGVKGTTLTGNYAHSSFSSERAADNDVWPEREALQDWIHGSFSQPIYEAIIDSAVTNGYFDGVVSADEYRERRREFQRCMWQGPVPRSINPSDDARSARERIKGGTSSPQIEAAKLGRNWREIVQDLSEYLDYTREKGIPDEIALQQIGLEVTGSTQVGDETDDGETVEEEGAEAATT